MSDEQPQHVVSLEIVLLDPGLAEVGGHHPGVVASLVQQLNSVSNIQLKVYSHKTLPDEFDAVVASPGVNIVRHFTTRFYEHYFSEADIARRQQYIGQLAQEYTTAIEDSNNSHSVKRIYLYHTLNWEHANALALALKKLYETLSLQQHLVFLMFSPKAPRESFADIGGDAVHLQKTGCGADVKRMVNFRFAFNFLRQIPGVRLFAADAELAKCYQQLLEVNRPLEVHPCVVYRPTVTPATRHHDAEKCLKVLVYVGDAKKNKGFTALPGILGRLLQAQYVTRVIFTVQYTLTSSCPVLAETDATLVGLAGHETRISLIRKFWTDDELHASLAEHDVMLFNYSSSEYAYKNSGLLWLAAGYRHKIIFIEENYSTVGSSSDNSWLIREAKRLQCDFLVCSKDSLPLRLEKMSKQFGTPISKTKQNEDLTGNNYRQSLFQPLIRWLAAHS